jgi:hypothetical protein
MTIFVMAITCSGGARNIDDQYAQKQSRCERHSDIGIPSLLHRNPIGAVQNKKHDDKGGDFPEVTQILERGGCYLARADQG